MTDITTPRALSMIGPGEMVASAVSWPAIIAGGVAAAALTFILVLLGAGLGLSVSPPWSMTAEGAAAIGAGAIIWLIVTEWIAAAVGGYLTGRLRTKWAGVHTHEVFFRDTANGFLAWCLGVVVAGVIFALTGAAVVGGLGSAATSLASGATEGAMAGATATAGTSASPMAYFSDMLFRPAPNAAPAADTSASTTDASSTTATMASPSTGGTSMSAADARAEGGRIILNSLGADALPATDKTYLASLVAAQTGLSQADAEKRVDDVWASVAAAKQKAMDAADAARKAAATLALFGFASLLIGAFIASVAAALGGHERDEIEVRYTTM